MIACRFNPRTRGILLVEMIIYVAIVFASIGVLGGATAMLCHNFQESTQSEKQAEMRADISEQLREDLRSATRLQWFDAPDAASATARSRRLRLFQSGDKIVEYAVQRESRVVYDHAPQSVPVQKNVQSHPNAKPQPEQYRIRTAAGPPVLVRSAGDSKKMKPTHSFEYYDITRVEHSKSGADAAKSVWDLAAMQQSEIVDATALKTFVLISLEFRSPHKKPLDFSVGATPRADAGAIQSAGEVRK